MKEQLDGSKMSMIFPVRLDHVSRLMNLITVISFYRQRFDNLEIIIAHDKTKKEVKKLEEPIDGTKSITKTLKKISDKYIARAGDPLFSKWWCYNTAALQTDRPYLFCTDTDVVVEPLAIETALKNIDEHKVVLPYNGTALYCQPQVRSVFVKHNYNMTVLRGVVPQNIKQGLRTQHVHIGHLRSPGGAVIFERDTFLEYGGYNPKFKGWGYEDDEILKRFNKLGANPSRNTANTDLLWHFHHEDAIKEKHGHYKINQQLCSQTASGTLEELKISSPPLE